MPVKTDKESSRLVAESIRSNFGLHFEHRGMNDRVPNEKDFLAGAEAQAAQEFLRRHMAEAMTSSQIETLIRHVGLKTRRDLQYLTEEDFCDPIKSCLKTEVIPAIPVRNLLH